MTPDSKADDGIDPTTEATSDPEDRDLTAGTDPEAADAEEDDEDDDDDEPGAA